MACNNLRFRVGRRCTSGPVLDGPPAQTDKRLTHLRLFEASAGRQRDRETAGLRPGPPPHLRCFGAPSRARPAGLEPATPGLEFSGARPPEAAGVRCCLAGAKPSPLQVAESRWRQHQIVRQLLVELSSVLSSMTTNHGSNVGISSTTTVQTMSSWHIDTTVIRLLEASRHATDTERVPVVLAAQARRTRTLRPTR